MKKLLTDQRLLESIYDEIRTKEKLVLEIIVNEDFKSFLKKTAPYAVAAGIASGFSPSAKGQSPNFTDYQINKTNQYSSLSPKEFYKKAKQQEETGKFSKKVDTEVFTKSVKNYLIKKLNGIEELKSSEDVYVDITNIVDKEDGSVMITVEITGKIFASSQEEADRKASTIVKNALEESNVSVDSLIPLHSESTNNEFKYKINAKLIIK